jgi:hypothetical protein
MASANTARCPECGAAVTFVVRLAEPPAFKRQRVFVCAPAVVAVVSEDGQRTRGRLLHSCANGTADAPPSA